VFVLGAQKNQIGSDSFHIDKITIPVLIDTDKTQTIQEKVDTKERFIYNFTHERTHDFL
jgi:hypothetical protein